MGTQLQAEIPKVYSPHTIESRWARDWLEHKLYRASNDSVRPRFALAIPPPNITGSRHMGHMLEHTEIDILMRWHRMRGENVLWLPGTDHASIATQMIVERELGREALPQLEGRPEANGLWQREGQRLRLEMGPEKFIERCWEWQKQYGDRIYLQFHKLGCSYDWSRARFTMDESYVEAIYEAYLLHYGRGRVVCAGDADLGLLAGDRLYAIGLARLVALGDTPAVAELADTIRLSSLAQGAGAHELADAVWTAGARAVGWGASAGHRRAKELVLAGSQDALEAMRTCAVEPPASPDRAPR